MRSLLLAVALFAGLAIAACGGEQGSGNDSLDTSDDALRIAACPRGLDLNVSPSGPDAKSEVHCPSGWTKCKYTEVKDVCSESNDCYACSKKVTISTCPESANPAPEDLFSCSTAYTCASGQTQCKLRTGSFGAGRCFCN